MSRRLYVLDTPRRRSFVAGMVAKLVKGWRVEFKPPARSLPQNDAMWGALTSVSEQHKHGGIALSPADWRLVFLDYFWRLKNEDLRIVPNLSGNGFVPLSGRSTSDLSVEEMSEYLDLVHATGAEWGVQFHDGEGSGSGTTSPEIAA